METRTIRLSFFLFIFALVVYGMFLIYKPFFTELFLALIAAVIGYPVYKFIDRVLRGHHSWASFVSITVIAIALLIPLSIFAALLVDQSYALYVHLSSTGFGQTAIYERLATFDAFANHYLPGNIVNLSGSIDIAGSVKQGLIFVAQNADNLLSGLFRGLLGIFVFLLALFYFFRDGHYFAELFKKVSPLQDEFDTSILNHIGKAITSVIRGSMGVAIIQGILAAIGYSIFGVPAAALWGFSAALASLIPTVGTSLVNFPVIVYLLLTGHFYAALGMALWAGIVIGLIDNLVGPYLIKQGIEIHQFAILLSVLGGLSLFGPIGFLVGPVVLSLFFALFEMYPVIVRLPR